MGSRFYGSVNNLTQTTLPDPDAVQEVRMEESTSSAQFATPATGIITTKSGTNGLHGTFFETARNNAVGIARARQNPSNFAAPHLVRNEFGASAGGPIILPHVYRGKDRSFWFFAYEKYSLSSGGNENVTVPTPAMRQGDFSGLNNSSGVFYQLYDPATTQPSTNCNGTGTPNQFCRAPFTNNQIPVNRLSPSTKILYDITPLPNSTANPLVLSNLQAPNVTETRVPNINLRLDHSFNESNKAYLRFGSINQSSTSLRNYPGPAPATIAADGFPANATNQLSSPDVSDTGALGYTHVFSPSFFSETIFSQNWFGYHSIGGGNPNLDYEQMLGLPNNFGERGFPTIGTNLIMPYGGTFVASALSQIVWNIDENVIKTIGRHQTTFGGRYRQERFADLPSQRQDSESFGAYATALENNSTTASNTFSALPNTGYQDADFFLGAASSYGVNLQPPVFHLRDRAIAAYFQDNYHVSRNLTANIGLRYEAHPAPWEKYGLMDTFDLKNDAYVTSAPPAAFIAQGLTTQTIITNLQNIGVLFETPQQAALPNVLLRNFNLNFFPRVGLAYTPFGGKYGTVIRGGYGRYAYAINIHAGIEGTATNIPFTVPYSQSYTNGAQAPDGLNNYLLRTPQSVVMGVNSSNAVNSSAINSIQRGLTLGNLASDYAPGEVTETSLTLEQPMKGNSALRLSWVWSHGQNLEIYDYYNSHPSNFAWEMTTGTAIPGGALSSVATGPFDQTTYGGSNGIFNKDGWSNDNALQANYQRLFHRGIAYQVMYVWSKPMRVGGNSTRDSNLYNISNFVGTSGVLGTMTSPYGSVITPTLPPARPAGVAPYGHWHDYSRWTGYQLDSGVPKQHILFNGIVDMPFGRGKRFLGNSNRFVDELVGGFQIAGDGNIVSQVFQPAGSNWGPTNPLKVYKHKAKITDCRSGVCHEAFEWFNGYLAPTVIPGNSSNAGCTLASGLVTGLPSNWAPYQSPIDTDCNASDPAYKYYGQNEVNVTLTNGTVVPTPYSPGPTANNPYSHTFLNGPINWTIDLSLFKVFPITEKVNLRVNVDAFNALNMQGYTNPNTTDGVESLLSSANGARQLQFTMRLTF
jgi:hypothetical protein